MKWTVRDSRYVFRDRWITVRADDCVTPAGVDIAPFYVLEYPDFVHVVALDREDRVVLVRQYRHGLGDVSLELPGGMADGLDPDPVRTAQRELLEETGYRGGEWELMMTLAPAPATFTNKLHLVVARGVEPGESSPEISEELEVEVVSRTRAIELARTGQIIGAQQVGMILLALER